MLPRRLSAGLSSLLSFSIVALAAVAVTVPVSLAIQSHVATPVEASTSSGSIAAGGAHSLALKSDGTVWAWGNNGNGQLGDNTTTERHAPVEVVGSGGSGNLTGITAIAAGGAHSLALKSDGTVWAWGWNLNGQLGDNTTTDRDAPVEVVGAGGSGNLTGVTAIAAGGSSHSLAL